jgi:hypothetical protein
MQGRPMRVIRLRPPPHPANSIAYCAAPRSRRRRFCPSRSPSLRRIIPFPLSFLRLRLMSRWRGPLFAPDRPERLR